MRSPTIIGSPVNAGSYHNNLNCTWTVQAPQDLVVDIKFQSLSLEVWPATPPPQPLPLPSYPFGQSFGATEWSSRKERANFFSIKRRGPTLDWPGSYFRWYNWSKVEGSQFFFLFHFVFPISKWRTLLHHFPFQVFFSDIVFVSFLSFFF